MSFSLKIIHQGKFALIVGVLLSLSISGCTSKFFKTKSANLSPFARQTISMVGKLHYDLTGSEHLYLSDVKSYIDEPEPFKNYFSLEEQVSRSLKGIIAYSLQVVSISEQNISVAKKNQALGNVLLKLRDYIFQKNGIKLFPEKKQILSNSLEKINVSETYIQALEHAQILINVYNAYIGKILDELKKEQALVASKIRRAITKKYAVSIDFEKELRKIQQRHYKALLLVSRYSDTRDRKIIPQIRKLGINPINKILKNRNAVGKDDLFRIYEVSTQRLSALYKSQEHVLPEINLFHKSNHELNQLLKRKLNAVKQVRLIVIAWSRAHGRMAVGIENPAEWYDVSETGNLLFGAAQKSIGL